MPPQAPDAAALQRAYQAQVSAVRARVLAFIAASWVGLGAWRDADVEKFIALVVPMVLGGQQTVSSLTNAYLARLALLRFGGAFIPADIHLRRVTGAAVRAGTPPEDVYYRAGKQTWTALSRGYSLTAAVQQGLDRAQEAAATDLQLAKTYTAREVIAQDERATGFRRVLEGPSSCGLCALAATQRYNRGDLLPIHPACDCTVEPLYGAEQVDPGGAQLARIHELAAEFFNAPADGQTHAISAGSHSDKRGLDFRDLVVVHQHGELGPVLARKGQTFTGPDDLAPSAA